MSLVSLLDKLVSEQMYQLDAVIITVIPSRKGVAPKYETFTSTVLQKRILIEPKKGRG